MLYSFSASTITVCVKYRALASTLDLKDTITLMVDKAIIAQTLLTVILDEILLLAEQTFEGHDHVIETITINNSPNAFVTLLPNRIPD